MRLHNVIMDRIRYEETIGFAHDIKKLLKRFRSLRADIEVAKRYALEPFHAEPRIDTNAIEEISGSCTEEVRACKIKKFTCRAIKGRGVMSGIRITYAYHIRQKRVVFIEIYFKGDKENEDRARLKEYLGSILDA